MRINNIYKKAIHMQTIIAIVIKIQLFIDKNKFNNRIKEIVYLLILDYTTRPVDLLDIYTMYTGKLKGINIALSLII